MEEYQLALQTELENPSPILTIGIGRGGNTLFLGADPETGLISVQATGNVDLWFDADDFELINELLQRAIGG